MIRARLNDTSESWIASIILVLNPVKLAGKVPYYHFIKLTEFCLYPNFQLKPNR
jgi:hypothetical protein